MDYAKFVNIICTEVFNKIVMMDDLRDYKDMIQNIVWLKSNQYHTEAENIEQNGHHNTPMTLLECNSRSIGLVVKGRLNRSQSDCSKMLLTCPQLNNIFHRSTTLFRSQ